MTDASRQALSMKDEKRTTMSVVKALRHIEKGGL